jgi:hypothetical protein
MKKPTPINNETGESVNLSPDMVDEADALALDEHTIYALVDFIFAARKARKQSAS